MASSKKSAGTFSGRTITLEELETVRETVAMFPNLSRAELVQTICEHLEWHTPSGTNKCDACTTMLQSFEEKGLVVLPKKQKSAPRRVKSVQFSPRTDPASPIEGKLNQFTPVHLIAAQTRKEIKLWDEYTHRYHYLGYKQPFGYRVKYFIKSGDLDLGCLLFSGAAKALADRDAWIGWSTALRRQNIHYIINNSRFLIFPWVKIKNLASHALAMAAKAVPGDYQRLWGFSPVLMETFVDPERYTGACYKAANWTDLGTTTGMGLVRKGCSYTTHPRKIFAYPLDRNFRQILCKQQNHRFE